MYERYNLICFRLVLVQLFFSVLFSVYRCSTVMRKGGDYGGVSFQWRVKGKSVRKGFVILQFVWNERNSLEKRGGERRYRVIVGGWRQKGGGIVGWSGNECYDFTGVVLRSLLEKNMIGRQEYVFIQLGVWWEQKGE